MRKKALSMLMGLVLGVTTIFSSVGTTGVTVYAAENGVTDADCTDKDTAAPTPDDTVPDANQYKYQKDELAAFCHFGPNTFNWSGDLTSQRRKSSMQEELRIRFLRWKVISTQKH